jgi:diacylglycerol O-acyltransferase
MPRTAMRRLKAVRPAAAHPIRRLGATDTVLWQLEADPTMRSHVVAIIGLQTPPEPERLRQQLLRATDAVPLLRHRIARDPLPLTAPRWEPDPDFAIERHLRVETVGHDNVDRAAVAVAEALAAAKLDETRPLWQAVLVCGSSPGAPGALVVKVHHALTDGVGAFQIAANLFDLSPEVVPAPRAAGTIATPALPIAGTGARFADAVWHEAAGASRALATIVSTASEVLPWAVHDPRKAAVSALAFAASAVRFAGPAPHGLSPVLAGRSPEIRVILLRYQLADFKKVAKSRDSKVNDVFLAAVAGGIARYQDKQGVRTDFVRLNMPVNVRDDSAHGTGANHFIPVRLLLPVFSVDPHILVDQARRVSRRAIAEPALVLHEPIARLLSKLPDVLTRRLTADLFSGVDVSASNVPGSPVPLWLAGSKITSIHGVAPRTRMAMCFALISHDGMANITLNFDPAAVTDPQLFLECVKAAFSETLNLTAQPAPDMARTG